MEKIDGNLSVREDNHDTRSVVDNRIETSQPEDMIYSELFTGDSLLELCNSYWKPSLNARRNVQPYLRGCKWSPDGTCCLSVINSDGIHIMELPRDLYEGCPSRERMISLLTAVVHVKEGGLVYDFCWYPKMNSYVPETCSWLTTKKNSPIQMWDAYDGSLRCSYRGYNAVDEMEPAISISFINEGSRLVGGYKNCLRTFDVDRPGREFIEHKIKSTAACITTKDRLLAVGSWDMNIQVFSISDMGTYKSIGNMHGHSGGITHMQFTPDGTKLVSGARKDNKLLIWDLRYYRKPLNILHRCVQTNQTIYFDISSCGRYLVSGGSDGVISVWDDKHIQWSQQFNVKKSKENVTFRFHVYKDSCNSISIHPSRPILATGSGQFHFIDPVKVLDEESDSSCNDESVQHTNDIPELGIDITSSKKSQEINAGSPSGDENPKDTEGGVQVEVQHKCNSDTEISNEGKQVITSHVEIPYQDLSHDFMEAHTIGLSKEEQNELHADITYTKPHTEEDTDASSNNIVENDEKEVCSEPPCKRRAFESISETPDFSLIEINKECIDIVNLRTAMTTSSNNDCEQLSCKENPEISENNAKGHSNIMDIDKECNSEIECEISNGRFIENEEINNKDPRFEREKDTLHKSSELCKIDNNFKSHRKSANLNISSCEIKVHNSSGLNNITSDIDYGNNVAYSPYAENNLTFWWIAKISDAV